MVQNGAEALVLACSDIGVDFPDETVAGVPVLDSMDVLATAILDYWMKNGAFAKEHPLFDAAQQIKGGA